MKEGGVVWGMCFLCVFTDVRVYVYDISTCARTQNSRGKC